MAIAGVSFRSNSSTREQEIQAGGEGHYSLNQLDTRGKRGVTGGAGEGGRGRPERDLGENWEEC